MSKDSTKQEFNINVDNYNKIRRLLRYLFVYGCYSRNDLAQEGIMSKRSYDDELRRIKFWLKDDYLKEQRRFKQKYIRMKYDCYQYIENYLLDSYLSKTFTYKEISLFFVLLQALGEEQSALTLEEILNKNISLHNPDISESTVSRNLDRMVKWGLLKKHSQSKRHTYQIADNLLDTLSELELENLYQAISFFCNVSPLSLPGYYLKKTLENYHLYHRKIEIQKKKNFIYHFSYFHQALEEEVIWQLLNAISQKRQVKLVYRKKQATEKNYVIVIPLKIILDIQQGRWFLIGKTSHPNLSIFTVSRIEEVFLEETVELNDETYQSLLGANLSKSWLISTLSQGQQTKQIRVKFTLDKSQWNYLLEKVRREKKWGEIEMIDQNNFILTIEVNDIYEIKPWLRSFNFHAEILPENGHNLRENFRQEWEVMLQEYEKD